MSMEKEQNLFMASISHELRTPLTSILGYGELLEGTDLDHRQQEYLHRMLHSSKYLHSLVGDFLDIVKIKNNDISLDPKEVRLHTILTECAELIKANLHKDVIFKADIPFLNHTIFADDRRIKQVMLNILSNAAKFTRSGTIKFYVKEMVYEKAQTRITVNIEDTGTGMTEEVQKALFDPFVTGDSTQGFGLGLFISQEIIRLMDGNISVSSNEGHGSIFSVSFIVKKAQDKKFSKTLSGKNILILSDQSEYTQDFSRILADFDATLQYYSSSQHITNTLNTILSHASEYDIIIFDMSNISCSVSDTISTLRILHPSIKCIALLDKQTSVYTSDFDKIIDLPIDAKDLMFELEALSAMEHSRDHSIVDFSHLKVLVVEDVEMSRDFIKELFSVSFSINCDLAVNGKEAVEKAENTSYDIIFMDVRMPVMNGHEATKKIRKFNKKVPIVCMSADVQEKDIKLAKDAGMDSFIEKPLDTDKMKQSFLTLMDNGVKDTEPKVHENIRNKDTEWTEITTEYNALELKKTAYDHLSKNFDDVVTKKLLKAATQSIEMYLNNINRNTIEQDLEILVEDFHAIKGVLANLGIKKQAETAGEIQEGCKLGNFQKVRDKKKIFLKEITGFLNELQKDIKL